METPDDLSDVTHRIHPKIELTARSVCTAAWFTQSHRITGLYVTFPSNISSGRYVLTEPWQQSIFPLEGWNEDPLFFWHSLRRAQENLQFQHATTTFSAPGALHGSDISISTTACLRRVDEHHGGQRDPKPYDWRSVLLCSCRHLTRGERVRVLFIEAKCEPGVQSNMAGRDVLPNHGRYAGESGGEDGDFAVQRYAILSVHYPLSALCSLG